jgi:NAD(P)H-flavin reductase
MLPRPSRIHAVHRENHDTFTLALAPVEGRSFPPFQPGQFNMLYVFGVGEMAVSISGDPSASGAWMHTVRVVGTVSRALSRLKKGDLVGVRGPFGNPWPMSAAAGRDLVLVAGGIGLAPLRPVLLRAFNELARDRGSIQARAQSAPNTGAATPKDSKPGRPPRLFLLYGARSPVDLLFVGQLAHWKRTGQCEVLVTVDRSAPDWKGDVGVVTKLIPYVSFDPEQAVVFVCGPEVMMRFTVQEMENRGVASDRIYLSMERNMKCAVGFCGHCQYGPEFICKDGPVFPYDRVRPWLPIWEV